MRTRILVDPIDRPLLDSHAWTIEQRPNGLTYVHRSQRRLGTGTRTIYLHREILSAGPRDRVDHVDHNGLNNRRRNLRLATPSENNANQRPRQGCSSRFKGVSWNRDKQKWEAYIRVNRRQRRLGYFSDELDAAVAYDEAAFQAWGEFALFNFKEKIK